MTDILPARVGDEPLRYGSASADTSAAQASKTVQHPASAASSSKLPPTSTSTSLRHLPTELIDAILDCVPEHELQRTAAALMRVSPEWGLSESHLFRHLRIERPEQLKPLWAKLRRDKEEARQQQQQQQQASDDGGAAPVVGKLAATTRTFTVASWRGDADLMVSIVRILPRLQAMHLHVGTNFSPEHLSDAFEIPKPLIRRVELRFRPYVDRASYYQFLKGSYFDSAIDTLVRNWDETPDLRALSLCQDVPPRFSVPHLARQMGRTSLEDADATTGVAHIAQNDGDEEQGGSSDAESSGDEVAAAATDLTDLTPVEPARGYTGHGPFPYLSGELQHLKPKTFAQPIVFFDIRCLARLATSRSARHVAHFRLRVPCRDIAAVLCEGANTGPGAGALGRRFFPSLTLLDLSTTNMRLDGWLPYLVRRYERLEHLILDRTNLFGFQGRDNGGALCSELGKTIVMAGLARGKDREREIVSWDVSERRRQAIADRERRRQQEAQREREEAERAMRAEREREERRRAGVASDDDDNEEGGESDSSTSDAGSSAEADSGATPSTAFPEHRRASKVTPAMQRARARRAARAIGTASFSIREGTARNRAHDRAREQAEEQVEIAPSDLVVHVLPPLPTVRSVNIGGEANRLDDAKANDWQLKFHAGWKDGLEKLVEWASTTMQRHERSRKAALQWQQEQGGHGVPSSGPSHARGTKAKGKAKEVSSASRVKPPMDVRLYRYPDGPDETAAAVAATLENPDDPFVGLVRVDVGVEHPIGDIWQLPYLEALADAQEAGTGSRSVVLCCVPDCEGPMRRGEDGDRMDGRSGMTIEDGTVRALMPHRPGCGHAAGRRVWSADG